MEYRSVKGFTGWGQIGILLVFLAAGVLIAGGVQFFIASLIMPPGASMLDGDAIMKAMMAPENVNIARINQILSSFALLGIPALGYTLLCNGKSMLWLGFSRHITPTQILLGFVIMLVTAIAAGPLEAITKNILTHFPSINASAKKMEELYKSQTDVLSNLKSFPEYIFALFVMAFFPAIFEEIFFRGAMQNILVRWLKNPWVAILITSIVFSLIHSSIYLFLSRLALGYALGLMYYYTKNIWTNIIIHFINNGFILTVMYIQRNAIKKTAIETMEQDLHWVFALCACVALVWLFKALINASVQNKGLIEEKEMLLIEDPLKNFAKN
jgi:uncharacterized protein